MKKFTMVDRILLLATSLLASFQVAVGIEGLDHVAILFYTLAFGALMVASLMLIILDREALGRSTILLSSTILPVCLALGIVAEKIPQAVTGSLLVAACGFLFLAAAQLWLGSSAVRTALVMVHGLSGLIIAGFPIVSVVSGSAPIAYGLVGIGGGAISLMGSSLAFQRQPIDATDNLLSRLLPPLLFMVTICFTAGMAWGKV